MGESDGGVHQLLLALSWWVGHLRLDLLEWRERSDAPARMLGGRRAAAAGKGDPRTAVGEGEVGSRHERLRWLDWYGQWSRRECLSASVAHSWEKEKIKNGQICTCLM